MQTFLPYADFTASAQSLDRMRLGKQRVEAMQILGSLTRGGGWVNHPATKMWRGYEAALQQYGVTVCREWLNRGYKDTVTDKLLSMYTVSVVTMPPWIGDENFHRSHRANLVRKLPEHYAPQFGNLEWEPYVWPR